jgi:FemAB-related protein (PEP-CTERM system-associated)
VGLLPLAYIDSLLFGRFLVSLPYVNWAGILAVDGDAAAELVDAAIRLADDLQVRFLELRNERPVNHPHLEQGTHVKVQMRSTLPETAGEAWQLLRPTVRTQIRKARKLGLAIEFGTSSVLEEFYDVFARNMRDLGTPAYGRELFASILSHLGGQAELCVVRLGGRAIAGALAIHTCGLSEVPTASALREFRSTAANSLMYWQLMERAIDRRQRIFDFGRSTIGSGTYDFKKKWGALAQSVQWQYYVREGSANDFRLENQRFRLASRVWRHLPHCVASRLGPAIVRGIP